MCNASRVPANPCTFASAPHKNASALLAACVPTKPVPTTTGLALRPAHVLPVVPQKKVATAKAVEECNRDICVLESEQEKSAALLADACQLAEQARTLTMITAVNRLCWHAAVVASDSVQCVVAHGSVGCVCCPPQPCMYPQAYAGHCPLEMRAATPQRYSRTRAAP